MAEGLTMDRAGDDRPEARWDDRQDSAGRSRLSEAKKPEARPSVQAPRPASPPRVPDSQPRPNPRAAAPARSRRRWLRPALFALLPLALAVGGYEYVTGGQYVSTENAYVQADMVGVTTDVSG